MSTRFLITLLFLCIAQLSHAESALAPEEFEMESYIVKLDKVNYLPNLLPIILKNKDFIGLTNDQVAYLDDWRKNNRETMLATMKEITKKRIEMKEAALSPNVSSARLIQLQNDIFRLHREV